MKGLLIKDLLTIRNQLKVVGLLIVFYIVYSLAMQDTSMLGAMIVLLAVMMPITAMAYDEKSGWGRYESALPVSKKTVVLSKYVFGFILLALGSLISGLSIVLLSTFAQFVEITDALWLLATFAAVGTIFMSLIFPILFRYGVEKGRMLMLLVIFAPTMLIMLLSRMQIPMPDLEMLMSFAYMVPIALLVLLGGSIALSIRIYERKEF